jgi:tetratricopeptide (TPR) repeat protein
VVKGFAMIRINSISCLLILGLACTRAAADEDIFKIGMEALKKNDYRFAIACFDDVIRKNPKNAEAHYYLGLAHHGKGDYDNAIKDFSAAIKLNPKHLQAYTNRGNAFFQKKEYDKALRDFTFLIEIDPKNASTYINRANVYKQLDQGTPGDLLGIGELP